MYLQDLWEKKSWKKREKISMFGCPHMRYGIYIRLSPQGKGVYKNCIFSWGYIKKKINFYYMIVRKYLLGSIKLKIYNNTERSVM